MIERFLHLLSSDESGQTMAEYAVVLGVITIAVVVTLGLLSTAISNLLNNVISSLWRAASRRHQAAMTPATPGR
jgi:Flp pilus assembly pilin Flp